MRPIKPYDQIKTQRNLTFFKTAIHNDNYVIYKVRHKKILFNRISKNKIIETNYIYY